MAKPVTVCYTAFVLTDSIEGYQDSPYPEIDYFVRSLVNKDGVQGGKDHLAIYK